MKKIIFIFAALFASYTLQADWDPDSIIGEEGVEPSKELQNPSFTKLKEDVSHFLKGSWCSKEKSDLLMDLILLTKPQRCVEIGAFTGSSVLPVAATLKYLGTGKVYAIDAWSAGQAIKNLENDDPNKVWWSHVDMKAVYTQFGQMVRTWGVTSYCVPVCKPSNLALSVIPESIDFLHLDGDYSEVGSTEDVKLYLPRVKSGGYILLSNLFTMVKNKQPKLKAFCTLLDSCEIVAEIERDNAVLFRKL